MSEPWKDLARQAGFFTSTDRLRIVSQTTQTAEFGGLKIVGHPIMPEGYVALVSKNSATVLGPNGFWTVPLVPDIFAAHEQKEPPK